ncbi:hypothetical protein DV736_g4629, partial [Chaetothyriales sp. CBS 134916]
MALPATPSLSPPSADLAHDYSQPHPCLKRRRSDIDDSNDDDPAPADSRSSIATGLKKLRLAPRTTGPAPTTTTNTSSHALPHSSAFPTSHPAYLLPQQPSSLPSPLHLTPTPPFVPGRGPLSPFLSPNHALIDRNAVNTPPPAAVAPASASSSRTSTWTDSMMLDNPTINIDTPNRVVINDLDAELAEIDAEEEQLRRQEQERLFFLHDDVDKQVSAIPADILRQATTTTPASAGAPEPPNNQALILYKEPRSFDQSPVNQWQVHDEDAMDIE